MSRFSGKCDFFDHLEISGAGDYEKGIEKLKNTDIYIGYDNFQRRISFESKNVEDLIPLFPYIILMSYTTQDETQRGIIVLSNISWVEKKKREMKNVEYDYTAMYNMYNRNLTEFREKLKNKK